MATSCREDSKNSRAGNNPVLNTYIDINHTHRSLACVFTCPHSTRFLWRNVSPRTDNSPLVLTD